MIVAHHGHNFIIIVCCFCALKSSQETEMLYYKVSILILQSTVTGVAGRMFLDAHIPVAEEQNIESECVIVPARALVVNGVLETQMNFKHVMKIHVQVNVKAVYV